MNNMGLFDKLKNVFLEEDFEDDIPVQKEEKPVITKVEEKKVEKEEVIKEFPLEDTFSDRELIEPKEKFKFPVIFEEEDFKEEKKPSSINVLKRDNTKYEPPKMIVEPSKKEKKGFKPSPVISPVYGVLDKNYSKDDITTKDGLLNDYNEVDIDYVIKKASGDLKKEQKKVKEVEEKEETVDLFAEIENAKKIEVNDEKTVSNEEIDEKIKSIDELLKDTTDEDFYSLVDSMYKDGVDE